MKSTSRFAVLRARFASDGQGGSFSVEGDSPIFADTKIGTVPVLSRWGLMLGCAMLIGLAGSCSNAKGEKKKNMTIQITSSAFSQGHAIPKKYTGEGADVSPSLAWANLPEKTKELALICDDPDAPRPEPWVHWVIYKIPAAAKGLPEGVPAKSRLKEPAGAVQGKGTAGDIGYHGPMPPVGHGVHHYHFKLYALDAPLEAEPGLDKKAVLDRMEGHVLAEGELMGTYQR